MFFKIVFRNLWYKPLHTTLSIALLALSTGIISLLLLLQTQLEQKFENDLKDIDLVVGAKGSPLQLVLSAVYHIDAPTGNISLADAQKLAKNPMVKQAIPLSYGDRYKGFRIVGTDTNYIQKYDVQLSDGQLFDHTLEVCLGANVAQKTGLHPGDIFNGTHGEAAHGEEHTAHSYTVTGVLAATNTVLDNLILTPLSSVWAMHEDEEDPDHQPDTTDREITALLVKFRSPMGIMTFPRMVNAATNMQAAVPALEINRLMGLMGLGISTLRLLAMAIMVISGFSVFIALYNRLLERRYELALLRSMGCSRFRLSALLLCEGLILALAGFSGGVLLSRMGIWVLQATAGRDMLFTVNYQWVKEEWLLGIGVLGIGFLAAIIPAVKAWRLNLSKALNEE